MTCAFSDDDSPNNGLSQLAMINKRRHQEGVLPGRLPGSGDHEFDPVAATQLA